MQGCSLCLNHARCCFHRLFGDSKIDHHKRKLTSDRSPTNTEVLGGASELFTAGNLGLFRALHYLDDWVLSESSYPSSAVLCPLGFFGFIGNIHFLEGFKSHYEDATQSNSLIPSDLYPPTRFSEVPMLFDVRLENRHPSR
jgi:hypothetical protein